MSDQSRRNISARLTLRRNFTKILKLKKDRPGSEKYGEIYQIVELTLKRMRREKDQN